MLPLIILEFVLELLPVADYQLQQGLIFQAPVVPSHAFFRIHPVPVVITVVAAVFSGDRIIKIHVGFEAVIRHCGRVAVGGAGFVGFGC